MTRRIFRILAGQVLLLALAAAPAVFAAGGQEIQFIAGDLQLTAHQSATGIVLDHLLDLKQNQELLARKPLPLFGIELRKAGSKIEESLVANTGWGECSVERQAGRLEMHWSEPANPSLPGVSVVALAAAHPGDSALHWHLHVEDRSTNWSVWHVVFPQLALADLGTNGAVFFPRGPGGVERNVWNRRFSYRGTYPGGWCAMQFMAAYRDGEHSTGLYVAMHDPWGSTKDLALKSDPASHILRLSFGHPAPNMGVAGNGFALEGEAVWQLLRGNWFDAAMIYKHWARQHAKWWPRLGPDGRADTPLWMRELNAWAMTGGAPSDCVPAVERFRQYLGVPIGFHWYRWHHNPFDNDYPHYFPARPGFAAAATELKSDGVYVMPYINGRLWDTHDRGTEDYEFTRLALAAATKQPNGLPYIETYASKETNGQPVRLAVMCPSTPLWQNTVSNIVLRLLRQYRTSAVYIDQVAAAPPKLCMDPAHGHPLGGGHWWNQGYWTMLDAIRRAKPRDTALTTECNGEPFIRWFDGYLTWHWQFDGQVPAFPAVYGGTIQMFGRAYRGGATKDLALRMKAAQQLVFGEQLGWLDPGIVKEKENAAFFRQMVQLRAKFNRYFYAGEMTHPPRFEEPVPRVKADWQWSGTWWVTTDAVLTGAWKLPAEHRLLLLFVNVSDEPVTVTVRPDEADWGLAASAFHPRVTFGSSQEKTTATGRIGTPVTFAPRQGQAWEMRW